MKTSPYLVIIFLKILVLTIVAGQLSHQFLQRRNRLFNQRRNLFTNRNSRLNSRTRTLKFPNRVSSGGLPPSRDGLPRQRLTFRNDLSSSARSLSRPRPSLGQKRGRSNEVFFVKLEDGFFGCQVNETSDVLQLFEISKLCDGTSQCWQGSDENNPRLKCTSKCFDFPAKIKSLK